MGMSMHCEAIRPPDEKWKKMKRVWETCIEVGVQPPVEVVKFFNGEKPDPTGVEVESVGGYTDSNKMPKWVKHHRAEAQDGFEVDITKLPKDVTVVRFICSY